MKNPYTKPPLSIKEQISLLKQRGMYFSDENFAENYLSHVHYYRLRAYWIHFEKDKINHIFEHNTSFDNIIKIYEFDRELRLLILDAIERIEVSLRAQMVNVLSQKYGSHAFDNELIFSDNVQWQKHQKQLKDDMAKLKSSPSFIRHFQENYAEEYPPLWAVCECVSLGLLSKYYKNLKYRDKKDIAYIYNNISPDVFQSWIHHLVTVRNVCAHHTKTWDYYFPIKPKQSQAHKMQHTAGKIGRTIEIIQCLLVYIDSDAQEKWNLAFQSLLHRYTGLINTQFMGI